MSEINIYKLTKEFCQGRELCFHPKTPDEARLIQVNLFAMGFRWSTSGVKILYCDELVASTLYLNQDGKMTWNDEAGRETKGVLCDASQFDKNYIAPPLPPAPAPAKTLDDVFNLIASLQKEVAELRQQVTDLHGEIMPKPLEKASLDVLKKTARK